MVKTLDGVGARYGVDGVGDAGFVGDDLLRAQSDQRGVFGGQSERFVHGVRVQGLCAAEHRGQRLDGYADDIVFRLLRGERGAGGLRVEAKQQRARIAGVETVAHDFGPEAASGAVLGDFFEKIAVGVEEKGELWGEVVDAQAGVEGGLHVGDGVGEREGDFLDGGRAGFADVVAGDGDGVPLGKFGVAPGEKCR